MHRSFKRLLAAAAFATATLGASSAFAAATIEQATLAIPAVNLGFIARYVAEDAGFWKESGLEVKVLQIQGKTRMRRR